MPLIKALVFTFLYYFVWLLVTHHQCTFRSQVAEACNIMLFCEFFWFSRWRGHFYPWRSDHYVVSEHTYIHTYIYTFHKALRLSQDSRMWNMS